MPCHIYGMLNMNDGDNDNLKAAFAVHMGNGMATAKTNEVDLHNTLVPAGS